MTQRNAWFDAMVGRKELRAGLLTSATAQLAAYKAIGRILTARIAATHDITRKLSLEDQGLQNAATVAGLQVQIAADLKQKQLDAAQKIKDQIDAARTEKQGWLDFAIERAQATATIKDDLVAYRAKEQWLQGLIKKEGRTLELVSELWRVRQQIKDLNKKNAGQDPLAGLFQVSSSKQLDEHPRGRHRPGCGGPPPAGVQHRRRRDPTRPRPPERGRPRGSRRWWRNTRPATRTAPPARPHGRRGLRPARRVDRVRRPADGRQPQLDTHRHPGRLPCHRLDDRSGPPERVRENRDRHRRRPHRRPGRPVRPHQQLVAVQRQDRAGETGRDRPGEPNNRRVVSAVPRVRRSVELQARRHRIQWFELELQLVDGFALLSRAELRVGIDGLLPVPAASAGNIVYGETLGTVADRINAILGDVGWPGGLRDVFSGNVRVGPKAYAPGASALDALFDAADGEFVGVANLWCSKAGAVTFRGRQARFRPTVAGYGIQRRTVADPANRVGHTDADPDPWVPVAELEWVNGHDNLYNSVSATPQGVGTGTSWKQWQPTAAEQAAQTVKDDTSIAAYGLSSLTFDNLQTILGIATGNDAKAETKGFATYYVTNYKDPAPRLSRLVFKSRSPTDPWAGALWNHLCKCEISDLLTLKTTHGGGGGFSQDFYVEGLHYTISTRHPNRPDRRALPGCVTARALHDEPVPRRRAAPMTQAAPHPRMHGLTHNPGGSDPIPGMPPGQGAGGNWPALIMGVGGGPRGYWRPRRSRHTVRRHKAVSAPRRTPRC